MRGLLTTQSQNCYREQIQKEMLTRLAWKSRYAKLYPTCSRNNEASQLPQLPASPRYHQSIDSLYCKTRVLVSTGDYTLDYRTPSCARSSVVKDTFYARNGVFSSPSATDTLG
ncbi:uncharacterized protein LOC127534176 [Acanthochromis polyacanthus]|uniref:uncharacterized protein LOC127534176 n=1 Tax=Acanthochromis polyacanthus TaxID=80966 RepID=UPI002233E3F6|nr:uncharacterized protein LOC127534176 [Acanthochromis polyacanthus]